MVMIEYSSQLVGLRFFNLKLHYGWNFTKQATLKVET